MRLCRWFVVVPVCVVALIGSASAGPPEGDGSGIWLGEVTIEESDDSVAPLPAAAAATRGEYDPFWWPIFQGEEHGGPVRAFGKYDSDGDGVEELYSMRNPFYVTSTSGIMRWERGTWREVPGAPAGNPSWGSSRGSMVVFDEDGDGPKRPSLFVAAYFQRTGASPTSPRYTVYQFDGQSWKGIARMVGAYPVFDLEVFDEDGAGPNPPRLFGAGTVYVPELGPLTGVLRWEGDEQWSGVGDLFYEAVVDRFRCTDLQVFDPDGAGPASAALFAGGHFEDLKDVTRSNRYLLSWNGNEWSEVGAGQPMAPPCSVLGMIVYDEDHDGPDPARLFVSGLAGTFACDEAPEFPGIVRWDGDAWSAVGTMHFSVYDNVTINRLGPTRGRMHVHDDDGPGPTPPALYFACNVNPLDLTDPNGLARWDGNSWSILNGGPTNAPSSISEYLDAFCTYDFDDDGPEVPRLLVGGSIVEFGMPPHAPDGSVLWLNRVSGNFVASWDGSRWESLGDGLTIGIDPSLPLPLSRGLRVFDEDDEGPLKPSIYPHGRFSTAGPIPVLGRVEQNYDPVYYDAVARWNADDDWSAPRFGDIEAITPEGQGTIFFNVHDSIRFDADAGRRGAPTTYAVGSFTEINGDHVDGLARRENGSWVSFGTMEPVVGAISPPSAFALAVWPRPEPEGTTREVLVVGGGFAGVHNDHSSAIGRVGAFDGESWSSLGSADWSSSFGVAALASFDPDAEGPAPESLIAAGPFTLVQDGVTLQNIASFDGVSWRSLGPGQLAATPPAVDQFISALAQFDEDGPGPMPARLFVAGAFTHWTDGERTIPLTGVARWDGTAWSAVGTPLHPFRSEYGPSGRAFAVFDPDGPGAARPGLYFGGTFIIDPVNSTLTSEGIARWDGERWHSLGGLTTAPIPGVVGGVGGWGLAVFDDDQSGPNPPALFVGGAFFSAGGDYGSPDRVSSWGIAKYGPDRWPTVCLGDSNRDGGVNFADITETLQAFGYDYGRGASSLGDSDFDGLIGMTDLTATLMNWNNCP